MEAPKRRFEPRLKTGTFHPALMWEGSFLARIGEGEYRPPSPYREHWRGTAVFDQSQKS